MHIWPEDELELNALSRNWSGEKMTAKNKTNYVIINFEKCMMAIVGVCANGTNVYLVGHFFMCVVEFVGEYLCIFIIFLCNNRRSDVGFYNSLHRLRYLWVCN